MGDPIDLDALEREVTWADGSHHARYIHTSKVLPLIAELREAREVLRDLEWGGWGKETCPWCGGRQWRDHEPKRHDPDCRLARVIGSHRPDSNE